MSREWVNCHMKRFWPKENITIRFTIWRNGLLSCSKCLISELVVLCTTLIGVAWSSGSLSEESGSMLREKGVVYWHDKLYIV